MLPEANNCYGQIIGSLWAPSSGLSPSPVAVPLLKLFQDPVSLLSGPLLGAPSCLLWTLPGLPWHGSLCVEMSALNHSRCSWGQPREPSWLLSGFASAAGAC